MLPIYIDESFQLFILSKNEILVQKNVNFLWMRRIKDDVEGL